MRTSLLSWLSACPHRLCKPARPLLLFAILAQTACSTTLNNLPGVYSITIQQGNIVDQAMIDQLRPHMSKRQVLFIMGSPMLEDFFHENRWDYLYYNKPSGSDLVQKKVTLYFENDQVVAIQGDFKPGGGPAVKPTEQLQTAYLPKRKFDKTLMEKITGIFDLSDEELDKKAAKARNATDNIIETKTTR